MSWKRGSKGIEIVEQSSWKFDIPPHCCGIVVLVRSSWKIHKRIDSSFKEFNEFPQFPLNFGISLETFVAKTDYQGE